jgi:hypothetical protein
MGSRHLAQGLWNAMLSKDEKTISSPTLEMVIRKARAEWDRSPL